MSSINAYDYAISYDYLFQLKVQIVFKQLSLYLVLLLPEPINQQGVFYREPFYP